MLFRKLLIFDECNIILAVTFLYLRVCVVYSRMFLNVIVFKYSFSINFFKSNFIFNIFAEDFLGNTPVSLGLYKKVLLLFIYLVLF